MFQLLSMERPWSAGARAVVTASPEPGAANAWGASTSAMVAATGSAEASRMRRRVLSIGASFLPEPSADSHPDDCPWTEADKCRRLTPSMGDDEKYAVN